MPAPDVAPVLLLRVATLEDLRRLPAPRLVPPHFRLELAFPSVAPERLAMFESRMARALAACGCREGSIATLLYAATALAAGFLGYLALRSWTTWAGLAVGLVLASAAGKVAGLTFADIRLRRVAAELEREVRGEEKSRG